jgi:membrane protease YdiL (CAAX protease family)
MVARRDVLMSVPAKAVSRPMRSYVQFVAAVFYFFLARSLARHSAVSFQPQWSPLAEQAILVLLLLVGYAAMGFWFQRQNHPINEQGFPRRAGWRGEVSLGLAIGWAIALLCVLPMVLAGGIAISITGGLQDWGWLLADVAFFALAAFAEEIAFRGYGFQRFMDAVGPIGATLGFAAFYAFIQALIPGSTHASFAVSLALSVLLSTAYLRTRALWVSWGLNFGWKASRALLFGLAVNGLSNHSPIVQGDPMGPFWLTGGGFGLDGTWIAFLVLLLAFPALYQITHDLDYRHNAPVLVPGGMPVDLDAAARAQHDAAMGPAAPIALPGSLVQIAPVSTPPSPPQPTPDSPETSS